METVAEEEAQAPECVVRRVRLVQRLILSCEGGAHGSDGFAMLLEEDLDGGHPEWSDEERLLANDTAQPCVVTPLASAAMALWRATPVRARGTIPSPRANYASALIDGSLHVLGGFDGKETFDEAFVLTVEHMTWRKVKLERPDDATLTKRMLYGHATHNKIIYVFGGVNNQNMAEMSGDVTAYDTEAGTLVTVETEGPSPGKIARQACATLGDSIWVIGGWDGKNWLDTTHRLRLPTAGGGRAYKHHTHRARWELVPTEVRSSRFES